MAATNNNQQTHHKDNYDVYEDNSTYSYVEEISDSNNIEVNPEPYTNYNDDIESLGSTITIPQEEHTRSFERLQNNKTNDSEDELDLIDTCTCIDCWTVYPKYQRSPSPSIFHNMEEISDNAYNNVFEWLSKNVEQKNQESRRNFAIVSTGKRKYEDTNTNNNERIKDEQEKSAKFQCRNERNRCDYSFQYQIV